MREIAIIGAFLAGLVGLFMSLCGGGFFLKMAFDSVSGASMLLVIPATFALCGAALFWACFKFIRRKIDQAKKKNDAL